MANYISKIKLANGSTVELKDAQARAKLVTLLGSEAAYEGLTTALGTAAWRAVASSISDGDGAIADAATVKEYVDAQVATIPEFDVVVIPDGGELPEASADTFHKIYLMKDENPSTDNSYGEYITVRSGEKGSYTYSWEKVGTTGVDVSGKVDKTAEIAGVAINNGITKAELQAALGLKALAYANTATGTGNVATIDSITMNPMTIAGNASVTLADTEATLTKADYTPAGSITGSAISGGSIDVSLKDDAVATEATLTTSTFTPAGTVAATEGGSFAALTSASFGKSDSGVAVSGSVSAPAINLTSAEKTVATGLTGGKVASFTEGAFTPAAFQSGFYTAGSDASLSAGSYTAPTLGAATKGNVASEGIVAEVGTGDDSETLIFSEAGTTSVVTAQGAFTGGEVSFPTLSGGKATVIDTTKFDGGSKAKDTFVANELQTASTSAINNVTGASLASAPVFTGDKFAVTTASDTALKEVAFTATNSADIVDKVEYKKQVVDAKSFTPVAATLGFSGTKVENALVTGVSYKKAGESAAFSVEATPTAGSYIRSAKSVEVKVSPDAAE